MGEQGGPALHRAGEVKGGRCSWSTTRIARRINGWTPAIERDRRIALQDRSTRFFGTDFSFEDLEGATSTNDYVLPATIPWLGRPAGRFSRHRANRSRRSRSRSSGSARIITHSRFENYIMDQVARRLDYSNIRNVQGIWTAMQLEMTDVRRGSAHASRWTSSNTTCR
jgi:hypothetical protein